MHWWENHPKVDKCTGTFIRNSRVHDAAPMYQENSSEDDDIQGWPRLIGREGLVHVVCKYTFRYLPANITLCLRAVVHLK